MRDLPKTFEEDPDRARELVGKLVGRITLRRKDGRLQAEMRGNVPGILNLEGPWSVTMVPEEGLEPPRA